MTLAAGGAVALGAAPLGAVFDEWSWLWYAWAAVATVTGAHLLARYLRMPAPLVPVFGAAGLLLYLTAVFCTDGALFGIIPTPDSLRLLHAGIDEGFQNINDFATPVPTTTGLVLLTAGALGLTTIVVDVLAVSLRRPAVSGLALLALYAVPVAVVLGGVPWVLFAIAACGYLMLLLVEGRDRLAHWGRPVGAAPRSAGAAAGPIQVPPDDAPAPLTGQRIGAVAIALAVILPVMVPGMTGNTLNKLSQSGTGDGTGNGNGPLNEFAALRGQLRQGQQITLMTVSTDLPRPQYLRTKVLDRYQDNVGWTASNVSARTQVGDGNELPAPDADGLSPNTTPYNTEVKLTGDYNDNYLPVYYAPDRLDNVGDGWRYDNGKSVIVSDRRSGDFTYTVHGNEPTPSVEELESSQQLSNEQANRLPDRVTIVPADLPKKVSDTAKQITRDRNSPYEKAKAINDYFTDGTHGFEYSETTIDGNSGSKLVDFLTNKHGFCEQYAAAMAVMLRVLDIPSRVVIGYTPGIQSDNQWTVTNHDAHAWVEAYFAGVGWTYFDPTPLSDGRTVAPAYAPRPQASNDPSSGSSASANPSAGPTANQLPKEDLDPGSSGSGRQGSGVITPHRLLVTAIVIAVILLLLVPAFVRVSIRRRRLRAAGGADAEAAARAAWDEVVGTAADYGVPVWANETPRGLARRLGHELDLGDDASRGLRLVALAEERARYAPRAGVDGDLSAAVRAVRHGLRGEAGRRRRWRAALLPPSTVRAARAGSTARAESASSTLNRLNESLRRPVTPRRR